VKLIHLLVVVAFLGISASVALADGVDPIVFTRGCGGIGQPACDAIFLTGTSATISATFACSGSTPDTCTASETVLNGTFDAITHFTLAFNATGILPDNGGTIPLSFACAPPPVEGPPFLFNCSSSGNTLSFTGGSLCPENEGETAPDGDECGVIIDLQGSTTTNDPTGTGLAGVKISANFSTAAPEPSSALLLMAGLMAGLVGLKSYRSILS
jgi:hypothetical protein